MCGGPGGLEGCASKLLQPREIRLREFLGRDSAVCFGVLRMAQTQERRRGGAQQMGGDS